MKKKLNLLLIVVAILAASFVTLAPTTPPPEPTPTPPPSEPGACSPGFWKNHTEIWEDYAGDDFDQMLADLQGGRDTRVTRFLVAAELNAEFPDAPCE